MAKRYRPVERDQPFLLPPDMREWLPADHPVWLVIAAVEDHLDTSVFHARRRTGGAGAAGYDPDMLVTVLVWAYAHQVTSSRRIEALCGTDVAFRVICGGCLPDHATIARFRAAFPGAAAELFAQVLVLCARLGMGKLGVVALDGTKIAADASKSANRTEETLRKLAAETVAAHAAADAAEDDLFGAAARGDEVPGDAWRPGRRGERIAAALAALEAERLAAEAARQQEAQAYLDAAGAGAPPPGGVPAAALVAAAQVRLDQAVAARQARIAAREQRDAAARAAGYRGYRGKRPAPPAESGRVIRAQARLEQARARAAGAGRKTAEKAAARKGPGPVRNITDPDARLMPVRGGGFIEGYNAQNVVSADGLIIATELTQDTTDAPWFEPMLRRAEDAARLITACRPAAPAGAPGAVPAAAEGSAQAPSPIGLLLADAGYLSEHNLTASGPDRLIATGRHRDLEKAASGASPPQGSPPQGSPPAAAMAARLATPDGIAAYRQRGHIAETPHGHIKHNMGFRQLSMRGKPKAAAEWEFAATVHNLLKAITAGHLTPAALNALAPQPR
jgi:transposase